MGGRAYQPLVSVIVPSYNKPEYLPECLESIRAQTFTDWECIVVSDGSPRVEEIRAAVAGMRDPRFRLVELAENRGPCVARNRGATAARGEWIAFVDSDDILQTEYLREMYSALTEAGGRHFGACFLQRFGAETRIKTFRIETVEDIVRGGCLPPAGGLFLRREAFLRSKGFLDDPILRFGMEDTELWLRLMWAEKLKPVILQKPLYLWRASGQSVSEQLRVVSHRTRKRLTELYPELFPTACIRSQFLAIGYRKSSFARLERGEKFHAIVLRLGLLCHERRMAGSMRSIKEFLSFLLTALKPRLRP